MRQWYAVYCKQASERIAEANLQRQSFTTYLPCIAAEPRQNIGRAPLFPRYLFISLDLDAERWRSVESTYGVIGLVRFGPRPSPVPDAVVEALRAREGANGLIDLSRHIDWCPGDRVEVGAGPMTGQIGVFEGMSGSQRAQVLMDLLGGRVRVALPLGQLRKSA